MRRKWRKEEAVDEEHRGPVERHESAKDNHKSVDESLRIELESRHLRLRLRLIACNELHSLHLVFEPQKVARFGDPVSEWRNGDAELNTSKSE